MEHCLLHSLYPVALRYQVFPDFLGFALFFPSLSFFFCLPTLNSKLKPLSHTGSICLFSSDYTCHIEFPSQTETPLNENWIVSSLHQENQSKMILLASGRDTWRIPMQRMVHLGCMWPNTLCFKNHITRCPGNPMEVLPWAKPFADAVDIQRAQE